MKRFLSVLLIFVLLIALPMEALAEIRFKYENIMREKIASVTPSPTPAPPLFYMQFGDDAYMQWKDASGGKLSLRVKLTNTATYTDVMGVELRVRAKDVWGDYIYGDGYYYWWTTEKRFKAGQTVYSDWVTIPDRKRISVIECAIVREVDEFGVITELTDDQVEYWYWNYK